MVYRTGHGEKQGTGQGKSMAGVGTGENDLWLCKAEKRS